MLKSTIIITITQIIGTLQQHQTTQLCPCLCAIKCTLNIVLQNLTPTSSSRPTNRR